MGRDITAESFIVRIYLADDSDNWKIAGLVERLDGTGRQEPFRSADELAGVLSSGASVSRRGTRVVENNDVSAETLRPATWGRPGACKTG